MSLAKKNTGYGSTINSYKTNEIATMSQSKLILMLYDGAIRFLTIARDNMNYTTYDLVNTNILKTQDIIAELMTSLDLEKGGEIAKNLLSIYIYLKNRLLEANVQKSDIIANEVLSHLKELKAAWEEIAKKESGTSAPNPYTGRGSGLSIKG